MDEEGSWYKTVIKGLNMKITDVTNAADLWKFMTTPSEGLVNSIAELGNDDIMVLGGSGKMGKELVGLIINADKINGTTRNIKVASTFSNIDDINDFNEMGVECFKGDLSDENFLASIPDAPYVVYMMGFKFGSSNDWRRSFQMNSIVPYLVGVKYSNSSIVVFSSGNPYPHSSRNGFGCKETDALNPMGIYGWNIVARESSFQTTAQNFKNQKIGIYRLMYAQHLNYGVLVDLARMVIEGEPISLAMPAVNLVSQRDANEVAIKTFTKCDKDGWIVNVAGPVWQVREIVEQISKVIGKEPNFVGSEPHEALLADDQLCRNTFGEYRDSCEEMIAAAAYWVMNNGKYWSKPTHFGKVQHDY